MQYNHIKAAQSDEQGGKFPTYAFFHFALWSTAIHGYIRAHFLKLFFVLLLFPFPSFDFFDFIGSTVFRKKKWGEKKQDIIVNKWIDWRFLLHADKMFFPQRSSKWRPLVQLLNLKVAEFFTIWQQQFVTLRFVINAVYYLH